jgi:Lon protease-like protein
MPERLLALFPLQAVLLPHAVLPLHIFEERYKEMIGECIDLECEFGVIQARGKGILRTGCTASIEQVLKRYDDGKMDIVTVGRRRFEIAELNDERSFLRASVEFFDDLDSTPAPPELVTRAMAKYLELLQLEQKEEEPPDPEDPGLSFRLGQVSGDLDFRQLLLALRTEAERMKRVAEHLTFLCYRARAKEALNKVSRGNGHGHHIASFTDSD